MSLRLLGSLYAEFLKQRFPGRGFDVIEVKVVGLKYTWDSGIEL